MTDDQRFETWWNGSKYMQVVRSNPEQRQIARDAFMAALASAPGAAPVAWAATSPEGAVEALGFNQSRRFDTPLCFCAPPAPDPAGDPLVPEREAGPHKLDTATQVFFYEQEFYVLSNFSSFRILWGGFDFATSEHAYHYEKFKWRGELCEDIRYEIRSARSAHDAFKIAEARRIYRRPDWDAVKVDIMRDILRAKAHQHEYVRRKLLETGDRELIENSWRDDFWGWGPNRDGKNMLGRLWMEIRAELRAAGQPEPKR
jgi:ribA/ribD-fused uncharacterized protein